MYVCTIGGSYCDEVHEDMMTEIALENERKDWDLNSMEINIHALLKKKIFHRR